MSLQYNIAQLLKSEVGQTRAYDFESPNPIKLDDSSVAVDVRGRVKFTLTNFGVLAHGQVAATLQLACARCLEPFRTPTEVEFEEEYQPLIDIATGLPLTTPANDTAFIITQNHTIDLREAVRQNLVLAVELIPLCTEQCRGLCPTCGVNHNTAPCTCPPVENSSPFAVLENLLVESEADQ